MVNIKKILWGFSSQLTDFEITKTRTLKELKSFKTFFNIFCNELTKKEYSTHHKIISDITERWNVQAKKLLNIQDEKFEDYEIYEAIIKNLARDD